MGLQGAQLKYPLNKYDSRFMVAECGGCWLLLRHDNQYEATT